MANIGAYKAGQVIKNGQVVNEQAFELAPTEKEYADYNQTMENLYQYARSLKSDLTKT